jgi:hypothetical protein
MAYTHSLLASSTVGAGGAASITFNNIPQNYTDLVLKLSLRGSGTADNYENIKLTFNSSITGYSERVLYGQSTAAASASNTGQVQLYFQYSNTGNATASTFSNTELYIPNYAGSANKSVSVDTVTENNLGTANAAIAALSAELWSSTTAINKITLTPNVSANFVQYSTAYLYGIRVEI